MQVYVSAFFNTRGQMTNSIEEVQKWRYRGITTGVVVSQEDGKVYIKRESNVDSAWYENLKGIMFKETCGLVFWKPWYQAKKIELLGGGETENVMRQIVNTINNLYCLWYKGLDGKTQEMQIRLIATDPDEHMVLAQNTKREFSLLNSE